MHERFIRLYDDALTDDECRTLIKYFDENTDKHERRIEGGFTELNYTSAKGTLRHPLAVRQLELARQYMDDCDVHPQQFQLQHTLAFESHRIKCYDPGQGFEPHTDEANNRLVAFLYYLNDDFVGGQTRFLRHDLNISPRAGQVLVFPATWEYLHEGCKVESGKKYLLSSYMARNATRN